MNKLMKKMFLDIENAQKLSELVGYKMREREREERLLQTAELKSRPIFRQPAQQVFAPMAGDNEVAHFGG